MAEDTISDAVAVAETVKPDLDALRQAVDRLARLDRLEYDQLRKPEAERLGARVTVLDSAVNRARRRKRNGAGSPDQEAPRAPEFSDEVLALRFADQHQDDFRYVAPWGKWFLWDGARWSVDDTLLAGDHAREICRAVASECDDARIAASIASAKTISATERLAKADRRLAATIDQWDPDIWKASTPAGTINLKNGDLQPHRGEDYITKITTVAPDGECPLWHRFLARITDGDFELEEFLQRMAGYALTGSTQEHALFFLYGTGANGKTVFVGTLAGILGNYHTTAPMEVFIASNSDRHPTELAGLRGARLVTAIETEEGRRWAESKIKALTGGDKIAARFMRQDFFEFTPQFKLLIAGKHKPSLRNVDEAIRRRMFLIPFTVTIPKNEQDKTLAEKLKKEWPGILQWMIEGCLMWQGEGLRPPEAVRQATAEYLEEEDAFTLWFDECCKRASLGYETTADLFASWKIWADRAGEFPGSQRRFAQNMRARGGFEPKRQGHTGRTGFEGVRLERPNHSDDARYGD